MCMIPPPTSALMIHKRNLITGAFLWNSHRQSNWLVRLIGGLFTESPALISTVRHLSIDTLTNNQGRDNAEWLDLLRQFLSVATPHFGGLSRIFVVPALGDLTEEIAAEVLPDLRLMNIEGCSPRYCQQLEFIAQFIARRRRSGRPVAIVKKQEDLKMQCLRLLVRRRARRVGCELFFEFEYIFRRQGTDVDTAKRHV
ncbi:hypothetical protein EDB89DRAFT_1325214 [Lactarius sanguifluus]|nr:hypothetical protein EDB89DRAFT_1325214 [Lactarius sanguifluus]